ncbi:MAG: hypothetical protein COC08_06030 [Maribacter sp.]|nr:MAG: hypothetical protein COC08_06030 [Maribacter sp.]
MKKTVIIFIFLFGLLLVPFRTYAQDEKEIDVEDSAEVFLEEYSDQFQESFFEALKQKGIENYDKAVNLLLECKRIDPDNIVVDHELAKAYMGDKKYIAAQQYAIEALISEPTNLWYLDTLMQILQKQGNSIDVIKSSIPFDNTTLKENLALLYFKKKNYENALTLLKGLKINSFTKELSTKINDSIKKEKNADQITSSTAADKGSSDPLEEYKSKIEELIQADNLPLLQELSKEALERYPSQPYFYYAEGHVLNRLGKHTAAVEILESALDYLLDDVILANTIYQELVDAYRLLNNTSKANMYLRMIKPGF